MVKLLHQPPGSWCCCWRRSRVAAVLPRLHRGRPAVHRRAAAVTDRPGDARCWPRRDRHHRRRPVVAHFHLEHELVSIDVRRRGRGRRACRSPGRHPGAGRTSTRCASTRTVARRRHRRARRASCRACSIEIPSADLRQFTLVAIKRHGARFSRRSPPPADPQKTIRVFAPRASRRPALRCDRPADRRRPAADRGQLARQLHAGQPALGAERRPRRRPDGARHQRPADGAVPRRPAPRRAAGARRSGTSPARRTCTTST